MAAFDFDFLSLTMGLVGLFFICCAINSRRPKHILEEAFGLYGGGLRHLKTSVFKKNQLVLGFVGILFAIIINVFKDSMAAPAVDGLLKRDNPFGLAAAMIVTVAALSSILYWLCRVWSKWQFRKIVSEVVSEHQWPFESNVALTIEIGETLGLTREPDDTVEAYLQKLRAYLDLPPLVDSERRTSRTSRIGVQFR